jgi:5-methylcytosine-specific restriction endonuclease McrA
MALRKYDKEWLTELCEQSYSYAEVLKKAGRSPTGGGSVKTLKDKIIEYQIDISHFTGQRWHESPNQEPQKQSEKYTLDQVFKKDSPVTQKVLRGYVERHSILEYKCVFCGCDGHWLNSIISLELDHIDGNNSNNEIKNLRYLCPNCHALTETYRGKNKALKAHKE